MYFKLKPNAGNHTQKDENGRYVTYTAGDGDLIESDYDLCALFEGKFELVKTPSVDDESKDEEGKDETPKDEVEAETKEETEDQVKSLGVDFTDKFPFAEEQEFKVFYAKGKGYFVAEADEPNKALNEKGIKKDDVEAFIKEQLKA